LPLPTPHREVPSSHGGRPKDNEQLTAAIGGYPPRRRPRRIQVVPVARST
jgi:hypothetical protein